MASPNKFSRFISSWCENWLLKYVKVIGLVCGCIPAAASAPKSYYAVSFLYCLLLWFFNVAGSVDFLAAYYKKFTAGSPSSVLTTFVSEFTTITFDLGIRFIFLCKSAKVVLIFRH